MIDKPEIVTSSLTKKFGDFAAVRNLNLTVPSGKIFGFLGPNGSGKSTTVKLLTGLLKPTSGTASVCGLSMDKDSVAIKRKIGVLPENLALFDSLTIWEHLTMCGPIYGLSRHETETRAQQLLKYLDIFDKRNTYVDQASHGMKKKCSLAMALLHNPKVLFLDEPFEGIDPVSSRNIKDLLILLSSKGVTIFITSHILEIVERLVNSFAIIVNGEIVCNQTMEQTMRSGHTLEEVFLRYVDRGRVEEMQWLG